MQVKEVVKILRDNHHSALVLTIQDNGQDQQVPDHFHITEIGRVRKDFIDCGGTRRESVACLLQAWTAHDVDHRLKSGKLAGIIRMADEIFGLGELPVEVEYGEGGARLYVLSDVKITADALVFVLVPKQTDCLAPDKCGVSKCSGSGCC